MKRILTSCIASTLIVASLVGCSAYKSPEKYIKAPAKSEAVISAAEIAKKLQEKIDSILEEKKEAKYTEVSDKEYKAQKGDQVSIYYTGSLKDKSVEISDDVLAGMTNKGENGKIYDLVLGSSAFIKAYDDSKYPDRKNEGFEDQLIGVKAGETVTVTVTFPGDYKTPVLQNQVAEFVVEVKTISTCTVDDKSDISVEYDFELVKDTDDSDNKDDADNEKGDNDDKDAATPEAQNEPETTEGSDDQKTEQDDKKDDEQTEEEKKAEELEKKFKELFSSGKFEIDFTEEISGTFNKIFNIKDYADRFKGKYPYYKESVEYTVPEDVEEDFKDLAGKKIKINFEITEVANLPDWNDEFVSDYTSEEYKTTADYSKYLEDKIKQDLAYEAILAATEVTKWPKSEVKKTYKTYVDTYVSEKLKGASAGDYTKKELKEILTESVYNEIYNKAASSAYNAVKERLVIEYLIEELDVEMSDKEYKEKRAEYYKEYALYFQYYYGVTSEKALEQYYGKESLKLQFLTEKLYEVIVDYVTIGE